MKAYGPVPSRRLGRSLGINNIPAKRCTYSCIYCQLGRTIHKQREREVFYDKEEIVKEVKGKVKQTQSAGEQIDYLSFVPDGEPTLDMELGVKIDMLRQLGIDVAVISNASLLGDEKVRSDLKKADWVSLKVDAVSEDKWRQVNRADSSLKLEEILEGMKTFANVYEGTLATETMLIEDINDGKEEAKRIANLIRQLDPNTAYLAVPTRPPAEDWAEPTTESRLTRNYQIFDQALNKVEYLIGYEGDEFASTGDPKEDLLSITSVHPMREEGVEKFLEKAGANWHIVEELLKGGQLKRVDYSGNNYYMRKLPNT